MELVQLRRPALSLVQLRRPVPEPVPEPPKPKGKPKREPLTHESLLKAMEQFATSRGYGTIEEAITYLPDTFENQQRAHLYERRILGTDPVHYDID